jgi:hypothetical protein
VHGAFGLPRSRYEDFKGVITAVVEEFKRDLRQAVAVEPRELKSGDLYKLPFNLRRRLMLKLTAALSTNGGFIAGFYTSNRGYVIEKIRERLISEDGVTAVPADHAQLYEAMVAKLDQRALRPGVSALISELLFLPVVGIANFLSAFECSFRVVYDPRQHDEDVAVTSLIGGVTGTGPMGSIVPATGNLRQYEDDGGGWG